MGENIKILEEFIKYYESEAISRKFRGTLSISVDEYDIDAIEHLLKAYKELEYKYDKALSDLVQAEHENKELKEENEFLKLKERSRVVGRYGEIEVHDLINKTLANDYIQISLVEEKIEELKQEKGKYGNCLIEMYEDELVNRDIKILQELIEEREEK